MDSIVPCNGCRLCCQDGATILQPEDDVSKYQTVEIINPITGDPALMLAHKENGECIYLGKDGCENYAQRPIICRVYDCRRQYLSLTRAQREGFIRRGLCSYEEFDQGKALQWTLSSAERRECIEKRKANS